MLSDRTYRNSCLQQKREPSDESLQALFIVVVVNFQTLCVGLCLFFHNIMLIRITASPPMRRLISNFKMLEESSKKKLSTIITIIIIKKSRYFIWRRTRLTSQKVVLTGFKHRSFGSEESHSIIKIKMRIFGISTQSSNKNEVYSKLLKLILNLLLSHEIDIVSCLLLTESQCGGVQAWRKFKKNFIEN